MTRLPLLTEQWVAWAAFRSVPTLYRHCARSCIAPRTTVTWVGLPLARASLATQEQLLAVMQQVVLAEEHVARQQAFRWRVDAD